MNEKKFIYKIKKDYGEEFVINFRPNKSNGITECTMLKGDKEIRFSLIKNLDYNTVKLYINKCSSGDGGEVFCQICLEINNICNCRCNRCGEAYCPSCYIDLFKSGKGVIKCPFCRFEIGVRQDESHMEFMVEYMKEQNGWDID